MIKPPKIVEDFYDKAQSSNACVLASTQCCCKSEYDDECILQQQNQSTREQISNISDISEDEDNEIEK